VGIEYFVVKKQIEDSFPLPVLLLIMDDVKKCPNFAVKPFAVLLVRLEFNIF